MAKPTTFPAAEQTAGKLPAQAIDHISDAFAFVTGTTPAALTVDVGNPPDTVLADVLADVVPHASGPDFPGADHAFSHAEHMPSHVTEWFLV